jgi:hypothetical protein
LVANLLVHHLRRCFKERVCQVPYLVRCDNDGCPFKAHSDQAASVVDGQMLSCLDRVKVFATLKGAYAFGAQDRVVLALMVGLTWADEPKAVEAEL